MRKFPGHLIARYRRHPLIHFFAKKCMSFSSYYENVNWDFRSNGELQVIQKLANQQFSCIFDVGANIGEWSITAQQCHPTAEIHAFEIVPTIADIFRQKIKEIPGIKVNNFGLSDSTQEVDVTYNPSKTTVTTMLDNLSSPNDTKLRCQVVNGDSYVSDFVIDRINFLKIDVEGSEHKVLSGFERTIREKRIDVIQFEYSRLNIISHFLLYDFYKYLGEYGYQIGKIYPDYVDFRKYSLWDENFLLSSFLAVHSSCKTVLTLLS